MIQQYDETIHSAKEIYKLKTKFGESEMDKLKAKILEREID